MTGPRVDANPTPGVLSGAQWSAAQSAPASALASGDPGKATTNGLGRVLTGDEWSQAQRMTGDQVKSWKIPALPTAPRDVTRTPLDENTKGKKITTPVIGAIMRQLVDPVLEHPVEGAAMLAALPAAPIIAGASALGAAAVTAGGLAFGGQMVYHIAQYGWQKAAELSLDPATRKLAEADPERISGEAAAVQAAMLGLAPLIHVATKSTDFGAGMTEAGVRGVSESDLGPNFRPGFNDAHKNADFAAMLERGAGDQRVGVELKVPKGFEPTAAEQARVRAKPVEGLIVPEAPKPGHVKPLATEPASAPLQEAADINAAAREYLARRAGEDAQDIAAARQADAERLLGLRPEESSLTPRRRVVGQSGATEPVTVERRAALERIANAVNVERSLREEARNQLAQIDATAAAPRRRPGGAKPAPYFETPQGAEVLGMTAARHGLPDDASPYHPTSPATVALDNAWKAGHDAATSSYPVYPEGFTMGGALTDNRIPPNFKPPRPPGFEPTIPEEPTLGDALKPSRFRGHSEAEINDLMATARSQIERAQSVIAAEDARDAPDAEVISLSERSIEQARTVLSQGQRELAMRGSAPGEPVFKGPVSLYRRLSDNALAEEYRSLLERRTAEEPNAVAPIWDAEREARAVDQIENRRRPDGSLSPVDKRRLATLQLQQGEGYGMGRHTFESAAAERRVNEYTRHIAAIEREMQSRGLDPSAIAEPTGGLSPVEGTGPTRTRGLSAGVVEKALMNKLDVTVGDLPEYRTISMEDQARRAAVLLASEPELALRVARGEAPAPHGLLPESVFVAVEQQAILDGDVNTLRELATGKLTSEATTMGQRIRALGERDPESPVSAIQDIINKRSGGATNSEKVARSISDEVAALNKHLTGITVEYSSWSEFAESLKC